MSMFRISTRMTSECVSSRCTVSCSNCLFYLCNLLCQTSKLYTSQLTFSLCVFFLIFITRFQRQLAQWVCNMRVKKKKFEELQLEHQQQQQQMTTDDGNDNNTNKETTKKDRRGRNQSITQEKIDRLDDVGFTWTFDRAGQKSWEERYQDLCAFRRENGHCNVPRKEGTFGEWVSEREKERAVW